MKLFVNDVDTGIYMRLTRALPSGTQSGNEAIRRSAQLQRAVLRPRGDIRGIGHVGAHFLTTPSWPSSGIVVRSQLKVLQSDVLASMHAHTPCIRSPRRREAGTAQ
jgi:hypothetical protein